MRSDKRTNIVSYNIAKLLNDNGYNEDTYFRIYPDGSLATSGYLCDWNENSVGAYSAPTYSDVVDWILDKYGIFIEIDYVRISYNFGKKFKYFVIDINEDSFGGDVLFRSDDAFETRNKAMEVAIVKVLEKLRPLAVLQKEDKTINPKEEFIVEGMEFKLKKEKIEVV